MRILIYIILIFLLYRIIMAFLYPKKTPMPQKDKTVPQGDEMVLDPVCQSYYPKAEALRVRNGNEITYFCSEECRGKFLNKKGGS
ncbi:MAG: transcriptional regulator [Deltaproteobacteria bacterium]